MAAVKWPAGYIVGAALLLGGCAGQGAGEPTPHDEEPFEAKAPHGAEAEVEGIRLSVNLTAAIMIAEEVEERVKLAWFLHRTPAARPVVHRGPPPAAVKLHVRWLDADRKLIRAEDHLLFVPYLWRNRPHRGELYLEAPKGARSLTAAADVAGTEVAAGPVTIP
jgi:hypothetical protein